MLDREWERNAATEAAESELLDDTPHSERPRPNWYRALVRVGSEGLPLVQSLPVTLRPAP